MLYRIPATRPAHEPLGRKIFGLRFLGGLARRVAAWSLYRNTALQLRNLDDHLLADIGVPRHEINARARDVFHSNMRESDQWRP